MANEEETAGEWISPLRLYQSSRGEAIRIVEMFVRSSKKVEDCQVLFSPNMPPCKAAMKITSRATKRTVYSMDVGIRASVEISQQDLHRTGNVDLRKMNCFSYL